MNPLGLNRKGRRVAATVAMVLAAALSLAIGKCSSDPANIVVNFYTSLANYDTAAALDLVCDDDRELFEKGLQRLVSIQTAPAPDSDDVSVDLTVIATRTSGEDAEMDVEGRIEGGLANGSISEKVVLKRTGATWCVASASADEQRAAAGLVPSALADLYTPPTPTPPPPDPPPDVVGTEVTTASGLRYVDVEVGSGEMPSTGSTVSVLYTLWLEGGRNPVDSQTETSNPFSFQIGHGVVIEGFEEGISSMNAGGNRRLIIPPELAYGGTGSGTKVPPNATLIFDIELLYFTGGQEES